MKIQLCCEDVDQEVADYIYTLGEPWEVFPGFAYVETNINTIDELHSIMEKLEEVNKGKNLEIDMQVLPANNDTIAMKCVNGEVVKDEDFYKENQEKMMTATIRKAKMF